METWQIVPTRTVLLTVLILFFGLAMCSVSVASSPLTGNIVISQVYPNPVGLDSDEEWFELQNISGDEQDIGGVIIGDEETMGGGEGMYSFPAGTRIAAGQYIAVARKSTGFMALYGVEPDFEISESDAGCPNLEKASLYGSGQLSLSDSGDELLILGQDGTPVFALVYGEGAYADYIAHPGCAAGQGLYRKSDAGLSHDCAVEFIVADDPHPSGSGALPPPSSTAAKILVSEAFPYPLDSSVPEWVEIYNVSSETLPLTGYKIGDEETKEGGESMYAFPEGVSISGHSMIVVAVKAAAFKSSYAKNPDFELIESDPEVPNLSKYSAWATGSWNLGNTGDEIILLDGEDRSVDVLCYGTGAFPGITSHQEVETGSSFERFPIASDTNDCEQDFRLQKTPTPGELPQEGQSGTCGSHVKIKINGPKGENDWFIGAAEIELTADIDAGAKLGEIQYRQKPDGAWTAYTSTLPCQSEGLFEYEARTIDGSGNIEPAKQVIAKIDTSKPKIIVVETPTGTASLRPTFRLIIQDIVSGVNQGSLVLQLDGQNWTPLKKWEGENLMISSADDLVQGSHKLDISISDQAGLRSDASIEFEIKKLTPKASTVLIGSPGSGQLHTQTTIVACGSPVYFRAFGLPAGLRIDFAANPSLSTDYLDAEVIADGSVRKGSYLIPIIAMSQGKAEVLFVLIIVY